ncbi:hypothetical protein GOP47_0015790 [Adiantum capillus-veneris]|uniref:Uncharacterized protein n=1 Tax=Adiantum capillus-veneris TaxID=13818 RepID=A0A9D4ZBY9_ADICA|nr:hypothetical protein GOP47_0015790 [Adiantum capillus-veneris]
MGYARVANLHLPGGIGYPPIEGARLSSKARGGCVVFGLKLVFSAVVSCNGDGALRLPPYAEWCADVGLVACL